MVNVSGLEKNVDGVTSETLPTRFTRGFSKVTLLPGSDPQQGPEGSLVKSNLAERTHPVLRRAFKSPGGEGGAIPSPNFL